MLVLLRFRRGAHSLIVLGRHGCKPHAHVRPMHAFVSNVISTLLTHGGQTLMRFVSALLCKLSGTSMLHSLLMVHAPCNKQWQVDITGVQNSSWITTHDSCMMQLLLHAGCTRLMKPV